MSFTWRYVVRSDGSFCRVSNIDGHLDNVSDEQLALRERPGSGRVWSLLVGAGGVVVGRVVGCSAFLNFCRDVWPGGFRLAS
jgi:hypothetical protein